MKENPSTTTPPLGTPSSAEDATTYQIFWSRRWLELTKAREDTNPCLTLGVVCDELYADVLRQGTAICGSPNEGYAQAITLAVVSKLVKEVSMQYARTVVEVSLKVLLPSRPSEGHDY